MTLNLIRAKLIINAKKVPNPKGCNQHTGPGCSIKKKVGKKSEKQYEPYVDPEEAVDYYRKEGAYVIQSDARAGKITSHVKALDEYIQENSKSQKASTVYRGMGFGNDDNPQEFLKKLKVGETLTDKGFMSTTTSQKMAKNFASEGEHRIIMKIRKTTGKGASIKTDESLAEDEKEVLFPRDSQLKVTKVKVDEVEAYKAFNTPPYTRKVTVKSYSVEAELQ